MCLYQLLTYTIAEIITKFGSTPVTGILLQVVKVGYIILQRMQTMFTNSQKRKQLHNIKQVKN
jgi:hypothetical protein